MALFKHCSECYKLAEFICTCNGLEYCYEHFEWHQDLKPGRHSREDIVHVLSIQEQESLGMSIKEFMKEQLEKRNKETGYHYEQIRKIDAIYINNIELCNTFMSIISQIVRFKRVPKYSQNDLVRKLAELKSNGRLASEEIKNHFRRQIPELPEIPIWDHIRCIEASDSNLRHVSLSQDGKYMATSGDSKKIKIWDLNTGREYKELNGHTGPVNCTIFSHDNKNLISASDDGSVRIWRVEQGTCQRALEEHCGTVYCVEMDKNKQYILSAGDDGFIIHWLYDNSANRLRFEKKHRGPITQIRISPSEKFVASCGQETK